MKNTTSTRSITISRTFIAQLSRVLALGTAFVAGGAQAATLTWDGGGDNLSMTDALNWTGDVVPVLADIMLWDATSTNNTVTTGTGMSVAGLQITNPTGPLTINFGTGALTLGASGIDMSAATQNLTLGGSVTTTLSASQSWNVAVGRSILHNSTVNLGANTLTINGGGFVNFAAGTGAISGTAAGGTQALVIDGAGTFAAIAGQASTFTGQTVIKSGATLGLFNGGTAGTSGPLGAVGVGNETIVESGGSLDIGNLQAGNLAPAATAEIFQIAGSGVGGKGALINTSTGGTNALSKVVLTANATISAGGDNSVAQNAARTIGANSGGRMDIRVNAAPTVGQQHLDLNGFKLTKTGNAQLLLVNAEVSDGDIDVNAGLLGIEGGSIVNGTGTITVNPNGALGFWLGTAGTINVNRQIAVNGGAIGDTYGATVAVTIPAPVSITGAGNPNFVSTTNESIFSGVISESSFTGNAIEKRGGNVTRFSNIGNSFNDQIVVYGGTIRGFYNTAFAAGATATPTDTPLGTASTVTLAGGTLSLRANFAADTFQRWNFDKAIILDRAPNAMDMDRHTNALTDKNVLVNAIVVTAPAAANHYSIGQGQFTFTQANTHRLEIGGLTMGTDTLLVNGDHSFVGNVNSNGYSLGRSGGSTLQFPTAGTRDFNALFNLSGNLRVGSGFGTTLTSATATAGSGAIFISPGAISTFREAGNIAGGQVIDLLSQRIAAPAIGLERFTAVSNALRTTGTGMLGLGTGGGQPTNIDFSKIGDGTFFLGSNLLGGGNNVTYTGSLTPGAGNTIRIGNGGITLNQTNQLTGSTVLQVGGALIDNARQTQTDAGSATLTAANNYSGGTIVNRGATLNVQNNAALGTGAVNVFGTLTVNQAGGSFTTDGLVNNVVISNHGGSTITLDNGAVTGTADVNRWGDNTALALNANTFTLNSRNNNASTSLEKIGAVTYSGGSVININRQNAVAGNISQLNVDSFTRNTGGTLEIARSTGTGAGFGTANIVRALTTAPATIPLSAGTMIAPHLTVVDGTRLVNFANYTASGIGNAVPTNTVNTAAFTTGLTAGNQYVYVDFAAAALTSTLGDNPDVAALKIGAGAAAASATTIANGAGTSIRIRTGGLIVSGDATAGNFSVAGGTQTTVNPAINFNDGTANVEALVNIRGATTAIFNGVQTAATYTKFGGGTAILTAANSLGSTVNINGGTLQLQQNAAGAVNVAGTANIRMQGGQLNVRGFQFNDATTANGITVAANIPVAVFDSNSQGGGTAANRTWTFQPPVAASPGLVVEGTAGTQGTTLVFQGDRYRWRFGTNAVNTFTGNVTVVGSGSNTAGDVLLDNGLNTVALGGVAPTITKAGTGLFMIGIGTGATTVAAGTKYVIDDGTLELRSLTAIGTGLTTSIEMNRGTLNLRRDSAGNYGGAVATKYPVAINGNATISVDRAGANSNNILSLGTVTVRNNSTLTVNSGNGYGLDVDSLALQGTGILTGNVGPGTQDNAFRVLNAITGGQLVKLGGSHLHAMGTSTFDGGSYLNQGTTRLRGTGALGTGAIVVNHGATIDFNSTTNLNVGQSLTVRSTRAGLSMISMNTDNPHPTAGVDTTAASVGIVGLSNSTAGIYNTAINLGALYGGGWSLGGVPSGAYDPRYTATSLGVGSGNLYRLGGGGTSFHMGFDSTNVPINNVLTGTGNAVQLGFDSGNLMAFNAANFQYVIGGRNDYDGGTTIHRGNVTRLHSAAAGGFSGLGNGAIHNFGVLQLSGNATLHETGTATNALTLHPGSNLTLNNNGSPLGLAVVNSTDRIADTSAISLNGAALNFIGNNNNPSSESLGAVTYDKGALIRVARAGTGTTTLTLDSVTRAGAGASLMLQTSAANQLGSATGDRILVTSAPTVTNGMVDPSIVNLTDGKFVTYAAPNGFANITPDVNLTVAGNIPAGLAATAKVNIESNAAIGLADNPVIYSLRTDRDINNGGPFNRITIRSGGLIGATNTVVIRPHLVFNDGTTDIEAKITNTSSLTLNNTITANGVTKAGGGQLFIAVPQPNYAQGWTVNSGDLIFDDLNAAGQSVAGNAITINGTNQTGGLDALNLNGTVLGSRVIFRRDMGTAELFTFSGGPITVVNDGHVQFSSQQDRNLAISSTITTTTTGTGSGAGLTIDIPFNRARGIVPGIVLNANTTLRVFDVGSTGDYGRISALVSNALTGSARDLYKVGNRTLELPNDNSATYVGGNITIGQGTVRVLNNGALGSATTTATIERNAALEIGAANFASTATLVQQAGSSERWNVNDARGTGNYTLPAGVNLQLNTNLTGTRTINLTGGTIEGFLYSDHPLTAVQRDIGAGVTVNLTANSMIGRADIISGINYDTGRGPTVAQPYGNNNQGAFLNIQGPITGAFNLTKVGLDTVTLSGAGSYNNTIVDMGVIRTGAANVLPAAGTLTTRFSGALDLYGNNQTVGALGTPTAGPNPGGVALGSSGKLINSAVDYNTLTVNQTTDHTYNGSIELNVALAKTGTSVLTLGNAANSYRGATTVSAGVLSIDTLANGGANSSIGASTNAASNLTLATGGTLRHTGPGAGSTDRGLTLGDGGGAIEANGTGAVNFTSTGTVAHTGTLARELTLKGTNTASVFAGILGDGAAASSLEKDGTGTWTASGTHTYTGNTDVLAGELILTGGISGSAIINVNAGAILDVQGIAGWTLGATQTLKGSGILEGNAAISGTVAPGASPGILTITGAADFDTGSTLSLELNGTTAGTGYDQLAAASVTIDGAASFTLALGFTPTFGDTFTIVNNTGGAAIGGTPGLFEFAGNQLTEGELFTASGQDFNITYVGGTGNDIVLTAVPEPGSAAMLLGGVAMLVGLRRRKK